MRRVLTVVFLAAVALAYALPMQSVGCAQTAHYAAVRSYASGTPSIDRYAETTCDLVRYREHLYAAKAPGLALATVPWYRLLDALGAVPRDRNRGMGFPAAMAGVPLRAIWQLGLWAVVAPALALLLLVRRAADRLASGTGTAVAAMLGLGTLVLPFSTLLFSHVLAAALAFAAFVLLLERRSAALAGVLAGLAILVDLPLGLVAAGLALYALRRAPAYLLGLVAGLVPLALFDRWAFGSPFHLPYSGAAVAPGAGGAELHAGSSGFFTVGAPSLRVAAELLLSSKGLLVLSPVLAAAAAGLVVLWRSGRRAEAGLCGGLVVAGAVWNSGRILPFGGWAPGPRYLVPLLPFLALGLAPALRRRPLAVGVLAAVSMGAMTVATAAEPLLSDQDTRHWLERWRDGNFTATVLTPAGIGHGWLAVLPFLALIAVAAIAAAATVRWSPSRRDAAAAAAALAGWMLVEHGAPKLLEVDRLVHQSWGLAAALALVAAVALAVVRTSQGHPRALVAAVPLLAFATVRFAEHTKFGLLAGLLALAGLALEPRVPARLRSPTIPA